MDNKLIISTIIFTLFLIGGGVWLGSTMQKQEIVVSDASKVLIAENQHDWGTIPINGGVVTKTFEIQSNGNQALQLHDINTSCMCTTAQITISEQPSPLFGMHQKSAWVGEVAPGQTALLTVNFDPAYHGPSGIGDITRQVKVSTNDPNNPELIFNLTAQVVN